MSSTIKKRAVYLDNAAATPIDARVKAEMLKSMELYGNPASYNDAGRLARKKIDESRSAISRYIGAKPEDIVFTSSGSEANNMAILGMSRGYSGKVHILATPIEHPSVIEPLKLLKKEGHKVTYLKVDSEGFINLSDFESKLDSGVDLVSVIYANNEIGTIQPILKISKLIKSFRIKNKVDFPLFHIDACQAPEYLDINVNNLGVDLMTFNGTKIYGPRGIGCFYVRKGIKIAPLISGGNQENGSRAGTENLPAIAGLAKAISIIDLKESSRISGLRDYFFIKIQDCLTDFRINGPRGDGRLPNNLNISIRGVFSEQLLLELDKYGIYASSGSACTSRSVEPSHVLRAIGVEDKYLGGALRLSLGRQTKKEDIDYVLKVLPMVVGDLRKRYG